jgi:hypothetical protein
MDEHINQTKDHTELQGGLASEKWIGEHMPENCPGRNLQHTPHMPGGSAESYEIHWSGQAMSQPDRK